MSAHRVQVQVESPDTRRQRLRPPPVVVVIVIGQVVVAAASAAAWVKFKASHFATFMRFSRCPVKR